MPLRKQNGTDSVLLQSGDALLLQDEGAVSSFDGDLALTIGGFSTSLDGTHVAPAFDGAIDVTLGGFSTSVTGEYTAPPIDGALNVTLGSFSPSITSEPTVQPAKRKKGGRVRKKRRYLIEIDGQYFDAINVREVEEILHQAEKIAPKAKKKPVIKVRTRTGPTKSKVINRAIRRVEYKFKASKDVDKEIGKLLQKAITRERMQEEALIALIL